MTKRMTRPQTNDVVNLAIADGGHMRVVLHPELAAELMKKNGDVKYTVHPTDFNGIRCVKIVPGELSRSLSVEANPDLFDSFHAGIRADDSIHFSVNAFGESVGCGTIGKFPDCPARLVSAGRDKQALVVQYPGCSQDFDDVMDVLHPERRVAKTDQPKEEVESETKRVDATLSDVAKAVHFLNRCIDESDGFLKPAVDEHGRFAVTF